MRTTTTVAHLLVRLTGVVVLILGLLFWTGNALTLIPLHRLLGFVLVLALWTLALLAARVSPGLAAVAGLWGVLMPVLGLTQDRLLTGSAHWVIRVLHLLVGLAAIGQGEVLARRLQRREALTIPA